jgi:hypothetical protein
MNGGPFDGIEAVIGNLPKNIEYAIVDFHIPIAETRIDSSPD